MPKRKILSKEKSWHRYWDCVIQYENGVQGKATLDESEILRIELEEKLEKLIARPVLDEILNDFDELLQSKYEEAANDAATNESGESI